MTEPSPTPRRSGFRIDKHRYDDNEALTATQHAALETELGRPVTDPPVGGTRARQAKRRQDTQLSVIVSAWRSPIDEHLTPKETP